MIVVPLNPGQRVKAQLTARHRAGIAFEPSRLTPERLRAAVREVTTIPGYLVVAHSLGRRIEETDAPRAAALPIYTVRGAFMKPWVVPHNRPPQPRTHGNGGVQCASLISTYPTGSVMMSEHAVVIAGGGPAGMMLAAELALAKVDVVVVERRPDHVLVGSRAGGFHARTIEVLDQRGVADRFLAEGQVAQAAMFGTTVLDMSDFPTRHPYSLAVFQNEIERIMADWIAELPVEVLYGREVADFMQAKTGLEAGSGRERHLARWAP